MTEKYEFLDGMREISGFGGSYEEACLNMIIAGVKYLDDNPSENPIFHGFPGVYGLIHTDNEDARRLENIMIEASGNDCTGAMMQATVNLWIHKYGWDAYVQEMSGGDSP